MSGFSPEKNSHLMLETEVAESFKILSGSRTTLQMYLVSFLHCFIFKLLMALISADKECSDLLSGMDGISRRILAALRQGFFEGGNT